MLQIRVKRLFSCWKQMPRSSDSQSDCSVKHSEDCGQKSVQRISAIYVSRAVCLKLRLNEYIKLVLLLLHIKIKYIFFTYSIKRLSCLLWNKIVWAKWWIENIRIVFGKDYYFFFQLKSLTCIFLIRSLLGLIYVRLYIRYYICSASDFCLQAAVLCMSCF